MSTSGNGACQLVSRSVLKDFIGEALTVSALQFVPQWDSPNAESVLATVGSTTLLMELIGVAACIVLSLIP